MKAKPIKVVGGSQVECSPEEATHILMNMPGSPFPNIALPIKIGRKEPNHWEWNGSTEEPTIRPSILTKAGTKPDQIRCHSYITKGKVKYLKDCTHKFADKTLDLLEVE